MDITRIACGVTIYLVIGLMIWMEAKVQDDIHIKQHGRPKYKKMMAPTILKIVFLWLPLYILAIIKGFIVLLKDIRARVAK